MKVKTILKKIKRGDVVSIDWIDAGDLSGGFQEKDAQLLVILSIVLNLILSFNPLCVQICQSNWILNNSFCLNGTVLGNLDDRFCLNSMVFIGNKESPSQTTVFAEENKCGAGIQENHPFTKGFPKIKGDSTIINYEH